MKYLYTSLVEFGTPAYEETVQLRDDILRKPLKLNFKEKDLAKEYKDYHLACYNGYDELIGCLVLSPLEDGSIKMRQVAVSKKYQRKGIGMIMVYFSEVESYHRGFRKMELNARDTAIPFYEKLGYQKTGRPFKEVSIKHYKMVKALEAPPGFDPED